MGKINLYNLKCPNNDLIIIIFFLFRSRQILDDFREAYYWLSQNTDNDARIMSWWDYGYQIAGMANRTTLVDNNTWNNSHIALVGKAMSSTEPKAYEIMTSLDVDYVLVIFGGVIGYSGDDINKFLWMVRIAEGEHPKEIRVYNLIYFYYSFKLFLLADIFILNILPRNPIILLTVENLELTVVVHRLCSIV